MIEQREIGGVPVLIERGPAPARTGLAFRAGFADEPPARRGIARLAQRLAGPGAAGPEFTIFNDPFAVREPRLDRLAEVRDLLLAEAYGRARGVAEDLPVWRHGARDYGLAGYPEWGLPAITEADLRAWTARYFTRDNAVLWVHGPDLPDGLGLDLPAGTRRPLPPPSSRLPVTPAWFAGPGSALAWDAIVPRGPAAAVFTDLLQRALRRRLHQVGGPAYTIRADHEPLGADLMLITAIADGPPAHQDGLVGGLVDVLTELRLGRIDPGDLAAAIVSSTARLMDGSWLPAQALGLLTGRPVTAVEDEIARTRAVAAFDVARVAVAAYGSGLLRTPRTATAGWAGFAPAPDRSAATVPGARYASLDDPAGHLVVGPDGVSVAGRDTLATVRFDTCAVALAWPDGGRQLIGPDGIVATVEPALYSGGHLAVHQIDARIPAEVLIEQPAREQIPMPGLAMPLPPRPARARVRTPGRAIAVLGLALLVPAAIVGVLMIFFMSRNVIHPEPGLLRFESLVALWLIILLELAVGAGLIYCVRRLLRRPGD